MKSIYKYALSYTQDVVHSLPGEARVVHVGIDPATLSQATPDLAVWAVVDPDVPATKEVRFAIHGTGGLVPDFKTYIGSVRVEELMWHVFAEVVTETEGEGQ